MYLPDSVNTALVLQLLGLVLWGTWPLFRQRSGVTVPAFAPLNIFTQLALALVGGATAGCRITLCPPIVVGQRGTSSASGTQPKSLCR